MIAAPAARPWLPRWPGWRLPRHPPRDTRDTLFLLAVIAWTVLPHATHLPLWCSLLTLGVLLARARLALVNAPLPGRWALMGVLLLAALLTLASYHTLLGKEPGITMAVVLMALKTLELRARRDAFVVFFLGFFLILTHFLYSQSLLVAAAMLVSVWGLLTALVLAHMPVGQPSLRQAGRLAARTALLGAPIMALMFVLFPRIGPLWGVPQDGVSQTGLSNRMRMGSVAAVALDDSVAMRIRFDGPVPPPEAMYFRGPVLSRFDGLEWRAATPLPQPPARPAHDGDPAPAESTAAANLRTSGNVTRYEMTLEPQPIATLPLLEAAPHAPLIDGYRITPRDDLQWVADRPLFERVRFTAEAYTHFHSGPLRRDAALLQDLRLPEGFNPRTLAWAAAFRRQPQFAEADAATLANALLKTIRRGGYSYTLAPGDYGRNAVDEFWLDRKEGFCEHFAAAFVVIMRAMNVPARVVTGYQGIDPAPVDGFYLVRQGAAHAWAEYWQEGTGWVRADPTAAVAPERISSARRLVPAPGLVAGALGEVSPALLAGWRNAWEAVNNRWNQWVLNYSRGWQMEVLKRLGVSQPGWEDLVLMLIGALSGLALAGAAWAWWDRSRVDPWVRQRERVRRGLRKLGLEAAAFESPRALSARVRGRFGAAGGALAGLLEELEQQRFGRAARGKPDSALTAKLKAALRGLMRQRRDLAA